MAAGSDSTPDSNDYQHDAVLLAALRKGEAPAFDELVRTHHGSMLRAARAIIGEGQAEEVVQDAWLAAVRHIASFEGRSSLRTWLIAIVRNEARSRLRKSKREVSIDDDHSGALFPADSFDATGHWSQPPGMWHDDSPEALLTSEILRDCLEKTLAAMPEQQRAVLLLRDQEEISLEEICNILSVTTSNVRVLIHRARVRLYRMIEHFEETGTC